MKTISLRTLLRDPKSVKKLTRSGHVVRVTDGGDPLWDLATPVVHHSDENAATRGRLWDEHFADLLGGSSAAVGLPSLEQVLDFSRGER